MDPNYIIVISIGIVGSLTIHLSQGLLKLAIHRRTNEPSHRKNKLIYSTGLVLNFSAPLWVIVANKFGPTVLYTSMYATGLIGLILFSRWKLDRPIQKSEMFGTLLVILGSVVIVLAYNRNKMTAMAETDPKWLLGAGLIFAILVYPITKLGERSWFPTGLVIGAFGGAFLAMDSLLKGIAQSEGGAGGFLPTSGGGWALFAISFIGAAAAFGMTQWAHAKKQAPTPTIAAYDAAYVIVPILLLPLAQGQESGLDPFCLAGMLMIVAGLGFISRAGQENVAPA